MAIGYVLYNTMAGNNSADDIKKLNSFFEEELKFINILKVKDFKIFLTGLEKDDFIIIAGGDGTLNRFVNDTADINFDNEILYFPNGTGNDFAHDLGYTKESKPFSVTEYLKNLPTVTVNQKKYRFVNGIGYGIDGYCCEIGDKQKSQGKKTVNYAAIAIKGLLFHYKPTNATVTVDGKKQSYNKVWLAPTMNGKYYGGGMMPTPNQERNNKNGLLSTLIFEDPGKLRTLLIFPSIFKGEHIKHTKIAHVLTGHEITVEFDRPTALQIDGETILGVTSYTAVSNTLSEQIADKQPVSA